MELSEQAKHKLTQLQSYRQQLQGLTLQKRQMESELEETKKALEELTDEKADKVFKAIGPALVKKDREEVIEDLKEDKEKLKSRLKVLKVRKKKLSNKIKELSEDVKESTGM